MVCNQAAGLPAVPVLQLSGQVTATNHGWRFHFLPFYTSHGYLHGCAEKYSGEVFCFCLIALTVWSNLAFLSKKMLERPEDSV